MAQEASLGGRVVEATDAFDLFVGRRLDAAYRLAALMLLDRTEAEDAAHDAFLKASRGWSSLRDPASVDAWFDRILVNECRDRLRRRRSRPVVDISDELAESLAIGDGTAQMLEQDRMRRAMARLGPDLRIVVVLRFFADLSVDEAARRLGVPAGTVKSRLHYALRELAAALAADDRESAR